MKISAFVVAASGQYIGLPYSDAIAVFYIALSSSLVCRVFRMLLLCRAGSAGSSRGRSTCVQSSNGCGAPNDKVHWSAKSCVA